MRVVVSDTGPLNYLVLIDQIELLPTLFTVVLIPGAVYAELDDIETPPPVRDWLKSMPGWLVVETPSPTTIDADVRSLDTGEQAAIALAAQVHADLLLMDDRAGVAVARARGFATTGTLGLLVMGARLGLVNLDDAFARLKTTSFRYRQEMLDVLQAQHRDESS